MLSKINLQDLSPAVKVLVVSTFLLVVGTSLLMTGANPYLSSTTFIVSTALLCLSFAYNLKGAYQSRETEPVPGMVWFLLICFQIGAILFLIGSIMTWPTINQVVVSGIAFRIGCILLILGASINLYRGQSSRYYTFSAILFIIGASGFLLGGFYLQIGNIDSGFLSNFVGSLFIFSGSVLRMVKEITDQV